MKELLTQLQQNLSFVGVCVLVVAGLALAAKLAEKAFLQKRLVTPARRVSIVGICAAIATVLHILDFPVLFMAPGFYKLDFSELPVLLCGFYLGPTAAVATEAVKIILKLLVKGTSTAFVGDFANFVVGCSMALPATIWYHAHRSRHSALLGLICGTLVMTVFGSLFNAVYLLPKFAELFHLPLPDIIGMGAQIYPAVSSLSTFVLMCVAPLNLLKGSVLTVLTMLLYKKVARPLFGIREKEAK